jgi:hypothetical protein
VQFTKKNFSFVSTDVIDLISPRVAGVVYTKPWMVELILDLAGYLPERPLARLVALEPSAGDGAFLQGMVRRLIKSCRLHGIPADQAAHAIGAFEIDRGAAEKAIGVVCSTLLDLGIPDPIAGSLARSWIRIDDFLEASLAFPIADFVIGNPPYIRLEEIPEDKAAFYRSGFGRACALRRSGVQITGQEYRQQPEQPARREHWQRSRFLDHVWAVRL